MTLPSYLTAADRAVRPEPIRRLYRFWLEFRLPGRRQSPYRRYFQTHEARDTYREQLVPKIAETTIQTGEDT